MSSRASTAALDAICRDGLAHHQAGRIEEARERYQQVLAVDPRHFDALHFLGVYGIQTGQLEAAVELIGQAISIRATVPDAYGNLANALNSLGRHADAVAICDRAIALSPGFLAAHGNRGDALLQLGRHQDALASYERVIALAPTAQAHFNRATVLRELGRLDEALASYERAIALTPDYPEAHRGRGIVLCELGRSEAGLESYDQAIALRPAYAEAHASRGTVLRELGRLDEALASQDQAIALRPHYPEAYNNRGNALLGLKRAEEALVSFEIAVALKPDYAEAIGNQVAPLRELQRLDEALAAADLSVALRPDHAEAHNVRGVALYDLRRLDEALASYDRAVALKPAYAEALNNRGAVLFQLRRLDEALASYDQAISLNPEFADAQHNQAMCRLARGDFAAGWAQYEWRWRTPQCESDRSDLTAPLWLGDEPLEGRTLLVHCEQGLGDTLQFVRYVPDVVALGARVVLEVQAGLERLLTGLYPAVQVITRGAALPPHDFQVPLMSLPLALGAAPAHDGPYLHAPPEQVAAWRERLPAGDGLRIGLCWAGGYRPGDHVAHAMDRRRSLPLDALAPLAAVIGATIYSLQKGPPAAQLAEAQAHGWNGPHIVDLTPEMRDFADTAAFVANLDLVIACDTAVAHLAGGLGKPVWILNRFDSCWRWLDGRTDTPWYASGRVFNQPVAGDWTTVVDEVVRELASWPRPAPASPPALSSKV